MAEIGSAATTQNRNPLENLQLTTKEAKKVEGQPEKTGGALTADFNTFLTLLTTQMKAQDPLNPMDNTEFIAQLASFSAVEQQVQSNKKLDTLIGTMSESSAGALAKWLDKEVRAPARAQYDGQPLTTYPPDAPTGTKAATIAVFDSSDKEIRAIKFTPGAKEVQWDGKDNAGNDAPKGEYRFVAIYADEKNNTTKSPSEVYDRVTEARLVNGAPVLRLRGGSEINPDDVTGVRSATLSQTPAAATDDDA